MAYAWQENCLRVLGSGLEILSPVQCTGSISRLINRVQMLERKDRGACAVFYGELPENLLQVLVNGSRAQG